jgi:DNA-binding beta-propeller fold protein YncE
MVVNMKFAKFYSILILFIILGSIYACTFSSKTNNKEEEFPIPTMTIKPEPTSTQTIFQPSTIIPQTTPISQLEIQETYNAADTLSLWVSEVSTDLIGQNALSILGPPGALECNDRYGSWYNDQPESSPSEYLVNLIYDYSVIPTEILIYFSSESVINLRVEMLNSHSGLGVEIYKGEINTGGNCPGQMSIPVESDLNIDTIILAFQNSDPPVHLDAVNLRGHIPNFLDIPVFWRIPIPADYLGDPESDLPGGLATDHFGNIYLANGNNGLSRYDVEGNLVQDYLVPSISNIRDVTIDMNGQVILTDLIYKWYVTFDQEGIQVDAGGEDFGWNSPRDIAVHPKTGNIYILDETDEYSHIRVYSPVNNQLVQDLPLETVGTQMHKGLAFDQEGFLYTLDQILGTILKLDADNGDVVNELGYLELIKALPADLAIDNKGNIYVLLNASPENTAVYIYDSFGSLKYRLGKLTYDGEGWMEGVFFFPVGISISPDGRFLSVVENGFLTTYLLDVDI